MSVGDVWLLGKAVEISTREEMTVGEGRQNKRLSGSIQMLKS